MKRSIVAPEYLGPIPAIGREHITEKFEVSFLGPIDAQAATATGVNHMRIGNLA
jgi:hypothetical protein